MITKRIRELAVVGLALGLGLTFGGVRIGLAQLGGMGVRGGVDETQLSTVLGNNLVAVETAAKDGAKVYNVNEGTWAEYRAPKGIRTRVIGGTNYVALMPEGPKITQLAAYGEFFSKDWVKLDLPEPVEGKLWGPVVAPFGPVYVAGRRVFAFSAQASKWAVLELPEGAEPRPITMGKVATVLHGDRLYIFNAKFARWDDSGDKPK